MSVRSWTFTWNNPPVDWQAIITSKDHLFNLVYACHEIAPSTLTPHIQGYVILKKNMRLGGVSALFGPCHWLIAKGSAQENHVYIFKSGSDDRIELDRRHAGSRTDIAAMSALVASDPRQGVRLVAEQMPTLFVKYHAGVAALATALLPRPPMLSDKYVKWFWGCAGTGKTHTAVTEAIAAAGTEDNVFCWGNANFHFAGLYAGQQYVVIDDLRNNWIGFSYSKLLGLLGRVRESLEVKGRDVPWCARFIWITAPFHPDDLCPIVEAAARCGASDQLRRRINEVVHMRDVHPEAFAAPREGEQWQVDSPAQVVRAGTPRLEPLACPAFSDSDSGHSEYSLRRRGSLARDVRSRFPASLVD